jgi:hypothetical protein
VLVLLWPHRYQSVPVPPPDPDLDTGGAWSSKRKRKVYRLSRATKKHLPVVYEERKEEVREVVRKAREAVNYTLTYKPNDELLNDTREFLNYLERLPLVPLNGPGLSLDLINDYLSNPDIPGVLHELVRLHEENVLRARRRAEEEAILLMLLDD